MDEELEIILRAVDDASSTFQSVSESANEMGTAFEESATEATTGFDEMETSATEATGSIQDVIDYCNNIDGSGLTEAADAADQLEQESNEAGTAVQGLSDDLGIINSGMLLQTAEQIGNIGSKAEGMAQEMNEAAITVGQLATQTGIAEPEMVNLINTISNATFPNDEAMMYVKSLDQMGVSSQNLGASATNLDKINDAFGMGASTVNSLGQELGVLGVDMNNVETAFNALAYANANTVGGMENYYSFLRKYDAQFKELGFDVDQSSIIIAAATQKYGGGRAALSGLSDALEEADGDTRKLEEALGIQAGTLDHASEVTGQYEGQLQQLADEEAEHKTILDQLGAAWEDVSLSVSNVLSPLSSFVGFIGQVGSFGMTLKGLKELGSTLKATKGFITEMNIAQTISNAIQGEGAIASVAAALGITTEAAAAEGATVAFGGLAIAEGAALWPILAIIAAIGLLVVAIYEIGKAFGWWTDIGSMLDAIWAGIQRLWSAFINHPDVQAVIQGLTDAWNALISAIGWAWNAILEFFGVATGGEFDIVRALIEAIGTAWEAITFPIRLVISIIQELIGIFSQVGSGQMDIYTAIITVWNMIIANLGPIFQRIINAVIGFAGQLAGNAITAAVNFVNNIISNIRALPGRFLQVLQRVALYILLQANLWVTRAINGAKRMFQGIINNIMNLPGRVYTYMLQIATRITSGASSWFSKATTAAGNIVRGVTGAISDLPGKVYNKVLEIGTQLTKVGSELYNKAKKVGEDIWKGITSALTGGAEGFDYEGMFEDLINSLKKGQTPDSEILTQLGITSEDLNITTDREYAVDENLEVNVNQNMELVLDLKNVPNDMDENTLLEALQKMVQDKSFIDLLVNNSYFQALDSKVKARLLAKANRARGV